MRESGFYELPEYSAILSIIDAIFAELNVGLLIYFLEKADEPSSLKLIYTNKEASRATGTDLRPRVGMRVLDAFPDLQRTDLPRIFAEVVTKQEARRIGTIDYQDSRIMASSYRVRAFPMPHGCVGVLFERDGDAGD